jgi:hypothetical protein
MPTSHDNPRTGIIRRGELILLRRSLIRLQDEARLLHRDLLLRKYNPAQPRVPAGGTGGGQWTSGGGGSGARSGAGAGIVGGAGPDGDTGPGAGSGLAETGSGTGNVVDETGQEAWQAYDRGWSDDGSIFEREIVNRDGSTIQSEYAASRAAGFDERHTVTLPGGEKTTFETEGRTQTIRDGGPDGEVISRTVWAPGGPEADASVQPAFHQPPSKQGQVAPGTILFGWLSPYNRVDGQQAVMGFIARDFRPSEAGRLDLSFVGQISQKEAEAACRYLPEMISRPRQSTEPTSISGSRSKLLLAIIQIFSPNVLFTKKEPR